MTWWTDHVGLASQSTAAAPATNGVAIDVPDFVPYDPFGNVL